MKSSPLLVILLMSAYLLEPTVCRAPKISVKKMIALKVLKAGLHVTDDWKLQNLPKHKNGTKLKDFAVVDKKKSSIKASSGKIQFR